MKMKMKILAVASGGEHWIQLMRLKEVFEGYDTVFVGVEPMYSTEVTPNKFYAIKNFSRLQKLTLIPALFKLIFILLKERPKLIITTGSAPGMLALRLGKYFQMRTVWIDSIANVEEMSLSGRKAGKYADLWLTQWEHLEKPEGPKFLGSVL